MKEPNRIKCFNQNLKNQKNDFLYHFGLHSTESNLEERFNDVKETIPNSLINLNHSEAFGIIRNYAISMNREKSLYLWAALREELKNLHKWLMTNCQVSL